MHINKHVQICFDCGHIQMLTDSSIPLTTNVCMYRYRWI